MATVKAIKYGMKGDDVANLQSILNKLGYNLTVDGSFGPKTLAAVKDYQTKNGLTVDGMVGPQTQSLLYGSPSGSTTGNTSNNIVNKSETTVPATNTGATTATNAGKVTNTSTDVGTTGSGSGNKSTGFTYDPYQSSGAVKNATGDGFSYDGFTYDPYQSSGEVDKATGNGFSYDGFTYDPYQSSGAVDKAIGNGFTYNAFSNPAYAESETVQKANAALESVLAAQPGAYQSKWQSQVEGIIDQILNRGAFNYDFNEDALYKQYAEQYMRRGKLAMQDTMGQAAAMT
ncbi:MAG: peptidoglycan-binding protein, partial [Clostridia bacterium]|nr:peptidoglycan-binding protein [Clostridia bacterium]